MITPLLFISDSESPSTPPPPPTTTPLLIIYAGESNSGGLADNSFASSPELASRTLKIFNNTTLASFDNLNIGAHNNLVGHLGLIYAMNNAHGMELQLANRVDAGDFTDKTVYLVKTGQGGTTIAMWADEATYSAESSTIEPFDTCISRITAAKALILSETGQEPELVIFWSQGINDRGIGTEVTTWKNATKAVLNAIRAALGATVPIFTTKFESITGVDMSAFNTAISAYASEMTSVTAVSTSGAETSQVFAGAGNHWGYTGMKAVSDAMINAYL